MTEQEELIVAAYKGGMSVIALARTTPRSERGIRRLLGRAGIELRSVERCFSSPAARRRVAQAMAVEYRKGGVTIRELADCKGVSYGVCREMLIEAGVELVRSNNVKGAAAAKVAAAAAGRLAFAASIRDQRQAGASIRRLAELTGRSGTYVARCLREAAGQHQNDTEEI